LVEFTEAICLIKHAIPGILNQNFIPFTTKECMVSG